MNKLENVKEILKIYDQEYLLEYYEKQENASKEKFLNQILEIDFEKQKKLYNSIYNKKDISNLKIEPIEEVNIEEDVQVYENIGKEQIEKGRLAIITLAGGQGTRLGHKGPKGTYMLISNKSLFEILCDKLKEANEKYNTTINWYIMTSTENNNDTIEFFKQNNYFNYPKENIIFFVQNDLPMNKLNGEILIGADGRIKMAANGHGGVFESLLKNKTLEDIKEKGIKWLFVTPIDNPLVELVDPIFVGIATKEKYNVLAKAVEKEDPMQKSGVFCLKENKVNVLEYTEISTELMNKKNEKGELFLIYAHINCNMFNIDTIEELLKRDIPYHIAKKKATYMNEIGKIIIPEEPNAYKYEKFIFDYFPYINNMGVYKVDKKNEYEPIKNNAEKARIAYLNKKGDLI